jgi:hypothetical protein
MSLRAEVHKLLQLVRSPSGEPERSQSISERAHNPRDAVFEAYQTTLAKHLGTQGFKTHHHQRIPGRRSPSPIRLQWHDGSLARS